MKTDIETDIKFKSIHEELSNSNFQKREASPLHWHVIARDPKSILCANPYVFQ
jgi:hypothetical protein